MYTYASFFLHLLTASLVSFGLLPGILFPPVTVCESLGNIVDNILFDRHVSHSLPAHIDRISQTRQFKTSLMKMVADSALFRSRPVRRSFLHFFSTFCRPVFAWTMHYRKTWSVLLRNITLTFEHVPTTPRRGVSKYSTQLLLLFI